MRIALLGAAGFIGRPVMAALLAAGHEVLAVVRRQGALAEAFPEARFLERDLAHALDPAAWESDLAGIDCVVNAAGLLSGPDLEAVHVTMAAALGAGARRAGVTRMVLISAISAREDVATDYARTKLAGEALVRSGAVDWTILRPSLVYGEGSYGGTSLMRGLAALPFAVPLAGTGDYPFTPIHVRDLARTIVEVCENPALAGCTLEPCGPDTLSLRELLARYRAWLGLGRARFVTVPLPVMRVLGRLGDLTGAGPIATNSLEQMLAGNAGDPQAFSSAIGFTPRALDVALRDSPAQVQDRWHARLFFLAPATTAVLVLLWLASAILGVMQGAAATHDLLAALGLPQGLADPLRLGSSALDLVLAVLVVRDRTGRWSTPLQFGVVVGYSLVIGWALPQLWLDPLGPLLKNLPIFALIAIHGVLVDKR